MTKVKINNIVEVLEGTNDEKTGYFVKKSGEAKLFSDDDISIADDEYEAEEEYLETIEELPEDQKERINEIKLILEEDNFLLLPDYFEINEYKIMESFCYSVKDKDIKGLLLDALGFKGAFKRFKEKINEFNLSDNWQAFKKEALKKIAINWCKENKIKFIDD